MATDPNSTSMDTNTNMIGQHTYSNNYLFFGINKVNLSQCSDLEKTLWNEPQSMRYQPLFIEQFTKSNNDVPEIMKPTLRSYVLQILIFISAIMFGVSHAFYETKIALYYLMSFIWIITVLISAYYEVDKNALKLSMKSFRGLVITASLCITMITDISRKFLSDDTEPLLTIIISDIGYVLTIGIMMSTDSVPRVTNFIRFMGPFMAICAVSVQIIHEVMSINDNNYILFNTTHASFTLNDIGIAAMVQTVWYGVTFIWAAPRDPKHKYFVFLDNKIAVKQFLPCRDIATEAVTICKCFVIRTKLIFSAMIIVIFLYVMLYAGLTHVESLSVPLAVIQSILMASLLVFAVILIYNYFQITMLKQLILQFRANMLLISIVILIYSAIQKIIWSYDYEKFSISVLTFLNHFIICIGTAFVYVRDGMNISYPNYFVIFGAISIGFGSAKALFNLTFGYLDRQYPSWFTLLEKQAFSQLIVVAILRLYYVWKDKENKFFVLIRKRKKTSELWSDSVNDSSVNEDTSFTELQHQLIPIM
eukprot:479198_1